LRSGRYRRDEVALGLSQTAGQCQASSYLALLKRGLHSAGYSDIPVVGISLTAGDQHYQPGFKFSKIRLITITIPKIMISDCLARLYYSTAIREKHKGESRRLVERFFQRAETITGPGSLWRTYRLIRAAVKAFNAVEVRDGEYPPVAIVGEIYVKYNSFGNYGIAEWLMEQGFEVISPPIGEFFAQEGLNLRVNRREGLVAPGRVRAALHRLVYALINACLHRAAKHMRRFKRYRPFHSVDHLASRAERACSLVNQFGEGWLIPGEIAAFAEDGVPNVICAQPFGCIANHIVGRGLEKRLKELYPDLNLLYLDFDSGTSEVNVTNRLHFFARNARESMRGGPPESNGHPPTASTNGRQRQTNGQAQELVAEVV
ncbi:MAG: hypothetical protein V3W14_13685, partial [Candidatus Neomarinimicrobiota bacterium]